jgi:uncharacterized protein YjbI with pentapeptide repeats
MPSVRWLARDGKIWPVIAARSRQGWQWLIAPRDPLTLAALRVKLATRPLPGTYAGRLAALGIILLLLLPLWLWYAAERKDDKGAVTYPHAGLINPILGGLGALFLIYAAIRQARTAGEQAETARKQAQIAADRHAAQTEADHQRRITESFSKAIEQLGSDKLEVRLGGIYALDRISQESPGDYWTVMENLTAFVRERTQQTEAKRTAKPLEQRIAERAYSLWEHAGKPEGRSEDFWKGAVRQEAFGEPPDTDIEAVLTVIKRRSEKHRTLETQNKWVLDLHHAVLRRANLAGAHLEGATLAGARLQDARLAGAHLEGANLMEAHLEWTVLPEAHLQGANLTGAHLEWSVLNEAHFEHAVLFMAHLEHAHLHKARLEDADLGMAHLEWSDLLGAHLEGANLTGAHLQHARLDEAHLEGATLAGAHLQGTDFRRAKRFPPGEIYAAFGDVTTLLPEGLIQPARWTQPGA